MADRCRLLRRWRSAIVLKHQPRDSSRQDDGDQLRAFRQLEYLTPPVRARGSLDRHATYIVAAYVAGAAR